jgi:hypothetical protein
MARPLLLGPGGQNGTRRKHRSGCSLATEIKVCFRPRRRGVSSPAHPRRNQRLMIPSGPVWPPGPGSTWPLRHSFFKGLKCYKFRLSAKKSNFDGLVRSHRNDGLSVWASCGRPYPGEHRSPLQCKARKSDGRGNPPGCPISDGSASRPYLPQRFIPLDTFQMGLPLRISGC